MTDRTIFLVDDDEAVRNGLSFLLRAAGHDVDTFPSAAAFLAGYDPVRRGCLVLDVRMPRMTGLELQHELNRRGWQIPAIFITGHGTVPIAIAAMKAGAFDFVEKPLQQELLLESVDRALRWDMATRDERMELTTLTAQAAALTAREREILDLVATGEPNKLIARRLGISYRTVEQHRSRIMEKLHARTTAEVIRMAVLLRQGKA